MKDFIYTPVAYQNGNNLYDERDIKQVYKNYVSEFEKNQQLQARIKELESNKHINEIKAQGIEEAISNIKPIYQVDYTPSDMVRTINKALRVYANKFRINQATKSNGDTKTLTPEQTEHYLKRMEVDHG